MGSNHGERVARLHISRPVHSSEVQSHTFHFLPTAKAIRVEALRVSTYLPPGLQVFAHESRSYYTNELGDRQDSASPTFISSNPALCN